MKENKKSIKLTYFSFGWHSFFLALTMSMIDFNTVFPALISELSKSKIIFGALYAILLGAPNIFNMIFSHFMRKHHYKKKFLILGIYMRGFSFLGMSLSTIFFAKNNPMIAVYLFFIWVFIFSASGGFAGIAYSNLIAKLLSTHERGQFYAVKQFIGSTASIMGGLVIGKIFKSSGLVYPYNYGISLFIGFLGLVIASLGFYILKEPASEVETEEYKFIEFLKLVPEILKNNKKFLNYIIVENISSFSLMILPFYMVFAKDNLGIDKNYIGKYLMYQITGMVISNIVWGFFIKRKGTKKMTGDCILIGAILPILAIILSKFGPNIYAVLFFIIGFVASGRRITFEPYLLDIIPSNKRVTYLGIRGTLNILMIIMPLVGATIIKLFGYYFTFLLVSIVMFFAYYLLKKEN
ncbi:MAG: hypothetical protein PWP46_914 [Fusobacteriaceae bacterium]|jgi:MFS family permease|nr:hypothetical protein [Fusobacteriales bacterium]MDN5304035.1 hypothetical protein [Fusobacteriaceae bacterium]